MAHPKLYSPVQRKVVLTLCITGLFLVFIGAATIPFFWESKSLWYKIGVDKTVLQMGKVTGLFAACLLLLQVLLAAKVSFLDKLLGLDRLFAIHSINGYLILLFAYTHVALVLLPEGLENLPIGWKFWPELIGAILLTALTFILISVKIRGILLPYNLWRNVHRPLGYTLMLLLPIHILFVSDSFEEMVPKLGLFSLFFVLGSVLAATKIMNFASSRKHYSLRKKPSISDDVISVDVNVPSSFSHLPGQFVYLSFTGRQISSEPHPFTIASSSQEEGRLSFYIKKSGDWTSALANADLKEVSLLGPYGLFSHVVKRNNHSLVFLAAGVGITPMLSMLEHISRQELQPEKVHLIWSLKRQKDFFLEQELHKLSQQIKGLRIDMVYSQEDGTGRLTTAALGQILQKTPQTSAIFLCGPVTMMTAMKNALLSLGFSKKNIYYEKFSL